MNRYLALEFTVTSMDKLFLEGSHSNKFSVCLPSEKEVLLQLANGLDYIHSQQLLHRDIRPENVHIFPPLNQLGPAVVKWAGFGLFGQVQTSSGSIKETYKFSLEWLSISSWTKSLVLNQLTFLVGKKTTFSPQGVFFLPI